MQPKVQIGGFTVDSGRIGSTASGNWQIVEVVFPSIMI